MAIVFLRPYKERVESLDETIWATQVAMAELFGCSSDNIGVHLRNIYAEGELQEGATTEKISVVQLEGTRNVNREPTFYNLDTIIIVDAEIEFERYRIMQDRLFRSDFEKMQVCGDIMPALPFEESGCCK